MGLNHVIWEITNKCNLKCTHCYNEHVYRDTEWEHLSLEDAQKVVDKISEGGYDLIDFLGGEPLLYPDIVELVSYVISKGMKACVVTNGTLLDEKMQEDLIKTGVTMISISIDGITPEVNDSIRGEGTFTCIIENLKGLQQKIYENNSHTEISLGFVINGKNIHQIPDLPEWAEAQGVTFVDIQHLMPAGGAVKTDELAYQWEDALKAIEKAVVNCVEKKVDLCFTVDSKPLFQLYLQRKYGYEPAKRSPYFCVTGTHRLTILPDGRVHPCGPAHILSSVARAKGLLTPEVLDVRTCSIKEIQHSKYFQSAFNLAYNPDTYSQVTTCQDCQFQEYPCQPCPLWALEYDLDKMEECEYAKRKLKELDEDVLSRIPVPNPGLKWRKWGNKIVLFDHAGQQFHKLDGSAFQIWMRMNGRNTVKDIIEDITAHLPEGTDRMAEQQILEFIYSINHTYIQLEEVYS